MNYVMYKSNFISTCNLPSFLVYAGTYIPPSTTNGNTTPAQKGFTILDTSYNFHYWNLVNNELIPVSQEDSTYTFTTDFINELNNQFINFSYFFKNNIYCKFDKFDGHFVIVYIVTPGFAARLKVCTPALNVKFVKFNGIESVVYVHVVPVDTPIVLESFILK